MTSDRYVEHWYFCLVQSNQQTDNCFLYFFDWPYFWSYVRFGHSEIFINETRNGSALPFPCTVLADYPGFDQQQV